MLAAALRRAGLRDHADEDADFGVPADNVLHTNSTGPTPLTVPGARTIRTPELAALMERRKPVVVDAAWGWRSIPGAVGLAFSGAAGDFSDAIQERLRRKLAELTRGDLAVPIVAVGWNSERFNGRNLALRLAALGYTEVYWYRGGREAWLAAGMPDAPLDLQSW